MTATLSRQAVTRGVTALLATGLLVALALHAHGTANEAGQGGSPDGARPHPGADRRHLLTRSGRSALAKGFGDSCKSRVEAGLAVVYLAAACYCVHGIRIVKDEYLVCAAERVSASLKISASLAGATIMAVAGNADTLAITFLSVFVFESDLGTGLVVGDAFFNAFALNGLAIFAAGWTGGKLSMNHRPFVFAAVFMVFINVTMGVSIIDARIHWYEAIMFLIFYAGFVFVPNPMETRLDDEGGGEARPSKMKELKGELMQLEEVGNVFEPEKENPEKGQGTDGGQPDPEVGETVDAPENQTAAAAASAAAGEDDDQIPPQKTHTERLVAAWKLVWAAVEAPFRLPFFLTIPSTTRWPRLAPLAYLNALFWIVGLAYLLVDLVTRNACVVGVSPTVVGMIFLSLGRALPDVLATIIVSRNGMGDMIVVNSLGTMLFDFGISLGLPWFLRACFVPNEDEDGSLFTYTGVGFDDKTGLETVVGLLFPSLLVLWTGLCAVHYRAPAWLGLVFIGVYAFYFFWVFLWTFGIRPFI